VKPSFLYILVLFLVAFAIGGPQMLAPTMTPAEAAEEEQSSDQREEELLRRQTARRARGRGRAAPLLNGSIFAGFLLHVSRSSLRTHSLLQYKFPPGRFNLLQVCRI